MQPVYVFSYDHTRVAFLFFKLENKDTLYVYRIFESLVAKLEKLKIKVFPESIAKNGLHIFVPDSIRNVSYVQCACWSSAISRHSFVSLLLEFGVVEHSELVLPNPRFDGMWHLIFAAWQSFLALSNLQATSSILRSDLIQDINLLFPLILSLCPGCDKLFHNASFR